MPSTPSLPRSEASSRTGTSPASNQSAMCGRSRCSPNRRTVCRSSMSSGARSESRSSRSSIWVGMVHVYTVGIVTLSGMTEHKYKGLATKAIHAGFRPDPATGAVNAPIYASSTFAQDGVGALRGGFEYARTGNPTRTALEAGLAAIEEGAYGRAFGSGMAATDCALRAVLRPGDHVVIPNDAYGGTFRLIDKVFTQWNVEYTPVALHELDAVAAAITPRTRLIWAETPTNPLLSIADIAALAELGKRSSAKVLVDNTFASPALQQPLTLGADIVLHSTTKYIGGHSDVVGGALVTNDKELDDAFAFLQNGAGAVPGPFDAYLTMRGLKTLVLRMQRHSENASAVAQFLAGHPAVSAVLYPGLPSHPGHEIAARQMSGFGGMVSVRMRGGRDA